TGVEANLLRALASRAGQAVSRDELARLCELTAEGERTIDVQVTRLRRKLEDDPKMPRMLQTVRGKGYLLRAEREG
ncbi:MAG: winged helix-turn-helix domain-containing protein, partial [Alphaproteobacteria bacterium]|nr:winged helix-turn-helix domain-containing protein [Alphaproteobacteria bacterium]